MECKRTAVSTVEIGLNVVARWPELIYIDVELTMLQGLQQNRWKNGWLQEDIEKALN